ncbi:VWA domain-containing protein [bacterium]|nr:VWA domain-containing protein [bacterium]
MRASLTVLLLCVVVAGAAAQNSLEIRGLDVSAYPAITLSLRVTAGGRAVYPPEEARIVLREDGSLLPVRLDCPPVPVETPSIALGIERSLDANFPPAIQIAKSFLARMRFTDQEAEASLWAFATGIDHERDMTRDSASLQRAVDGLSVAQWPFNGTALYECMHNAIEDAVGQGSGSRRAVVFVTDGYNNTSWYGRTLEQVRGRAAVDNVPIYVLLLRNREEGVQAMETLTRATGGFMLEHDVPGAVDSIYNDILRPDTMRLWCTLSATGRSCANGKTRQFEIGYILASGDTLWQRQEVTLPYREGDLLPLNVWFSPAEPWDDDTVTTVAMGVELREGLQPGDFTLSIPLSGMRAMQLEALQWVTGFSQTGGALEVSVQPPASGLQDGYYLLARFQLHYAAGEQPRLAGTISRSANGCLRYAESAYSASGVMQLDTVRIDRGGEGWLHLHVLPLDVPEKLQRITLTAEISADQAVFVPPFDATALRLPPGWRVARANMQKVHNAEQLQLELQGYADSAYFPVQLPLRVFPDAGYRIPVRLLDDARINAAVEIRTGDGMIVVRDSCYNNVVVLSGVFLSAPWPQPAKGIVSLTAESLEAKEVTLQLRDALGRTRLSETYSLQRGENVLQLRLDALPAGSYMLACPEAGVRGSFPLIIIP